MQPILIHCGELVTERLIEILDNWGYKTLAKIWRKESIEEMQHADEIIVTGPSAEGSP